MKTSRFLIFIVIGIAGILNLSGTDKNGSHQLADNEFKVIAVRGKIVYEKSGKESLEMRRGDIYVKGMPLSFNTDDSRASIFNDQQGRYVLTGNNKGKLKILPSANNISTRSGALLNLVDLKNHFDGRYLVIKRTELQINHESFPMDGDHFFYLKYDHNNETIAKKLRFEGDFLILDKEEIFKIDNQPIPYTEKEMTLYYKGEDKTLKINKFTPVFPDVNELKEEVGLMVNLMVDKHYDAKVEEITSYLNEFYGRPYKTNLKNWLKAEFKLSNDEK